jgi:hypothetical protein
LGSLAKNCSSKYNALGQVHELLIWCLNMNLLCFQEIF